jgi:tetratricopeptide (TPR) repeat protein
MFNFRQLAISVADDFSQGDMDQSRFESVFDGIVSLNASEGPHTNVWEPKFRAREEGKQLLLSIANSHRESPSLSAQRQICRCHVFLGTNMSETEELTEGFKHLMISYSIIVPTLGGIIVDADRVLNGSPEYTIRDVLRLDENLIKTEDSFESVFEYMEVLCGIGIYLSNRGDEHSFDDGRKVLHVAQEAYDAWNGWFLSRGGCKMEDIPIGEDGQILCDDEAKNRELQLRKRMDAQLTTILFLLAQMYSAKGDVRRASKYCHHTMFHQLLSKQEFSKKEWAVNALQLSAFYSSLHDYGKALHCLDAGAHLMPREPASEETIGVVAWARGKYHMHRLGFYSAVLLKTEEDSDFTVTEADEWWIDFPLPIQSPSIQPKIKTFDDAREEFKKGSHEFHEALKYYVVDGCCTDHINILQDLSNLYKYLIPFEKDVERQIAMHERRIALIEKFPDELNFQAYATLVRQLLFDLGDLYSEILDLRIQQQKGSGKSVSLKQLNLLVERGQSFFFRFDNTFKDIRTGELPPVLDEDSRVPFFRSLMRLAQLESKKQFKTARDEYAGIGATIKRYEDAVSFAERNKIEGTVSSELRLAQEMIVLLPEKQKDIRRVFNKQ